ncbi:MAG: CRISPR-associated endonuclease Cas1 [Spirochaetales bacterium]|nr:CRISPR-associated endonuclease Cas1 [Spirochaetales bacterium]
MDLYINTFGTYIHKKDDMFELEVDKRKVLVSPKKVRSIIISTHARITTDVVKLALDNNIDIVLMDDFGNPYGRFWHSRFGSTAFIRRRQLEIFESDKGLVYVKEWIKNKITMSIQHLNDLKYKRQEKQDNINESIEFISAYPEKIDNINGTVDEVRNTLQGYEGNASKKYYETLSYLMPAEFTFKGRSSRPAKDEFNCLLNYGFGVLYGKVEKACIIAGLDPFVGIMHTDNYNKKSLVFDIIENYRHLAVRCVFGLFSRKKVNKSYFDKIKGGYKLNADGKKVFLEAFAELLNRPVRYSGRNIANLDIIQFDCHKIANRLIGKE